MPLAIVFNYNILINALARMKNTWSAQAAEDILHYLIQTYETTGEKRGKPNIKSFNACINAWAMCARPGQTESALRAMAILDLLEELQTVKHFSFEDSEDDEDDDARVIVGDEELDGGGGEENVKKVVGNSVEIEDRSKGDFGDGDISKIYEDTNGKDDTEEVTTIIENANATSIKSIIENANATSLKSMNEAGENNVEMDDKVNIEVIEMVEEEQQEEVGSIWQNVVPNTVSYNSIIKAHANVGEAERAEEILTIMENIHIRSTTNNNNNSSNHHPDEHVKPDAISYATVLNAYAKLARYDPYATRRASDILSRMIRQYNEGRDSITGQPIPSPVRPNVYCFNAVLNAHAARGAGIRAARLLKTMEDMVEEEGYKKRENLEGSVMPDTYTYNTVLKALANSREKGSIDRAITILDRMEKDRVAKPDTITYNTLILACANKGGKEAGRTAETILRRMETRFREGSVSIKPTAWTYTTVIKAWMRSGDKGSTRRVEDIVTSLEQQQQQPSKSKSNLSHGQASSSSATTVPIQPDTTIYNALLNCWAKDGRPVTQKAEYVLRHLETSFGIDGIEALKPDVTTYTTVIDILSKSKNRKTACKRALEILNSMEENYRLHASTQTQTRSGTSAATSSSIDNTVRPNVYTYTAVINCFARSKEPDKAVQAVSILQQMEEQFRIGNESARPNAIAYNNVLNACAYTNGDAKAIETAFKIACLVFDEIRSSDYLRPTDVTYGTYLSVCANLMPDSDARDDLVQAVFKRCTREGMCSEMVLDNMFAGASDKLRNELLDGVDDENKIPQHWYRNL